MKKLKQVKKILVSYLKERFDIVLIFLCGLVIGFLLGYLFAISDIPSKLANAIQIIFESVKNFLIYLINSAQFSPNVNFLSDVAAFEAAIIALAIPLSFEIVSRISERYQSDVISRKFEEESINKWLPYVLIINIILAVCLRFYEVDNPQSIYWKIFAWIILLGFLWMTYLLLGFIKTLKAYMSNTESVIEKLFKDAEKSIQEK